MESSVIHAQGLRKRYGQVDALAGVDFDVPAGTVFGLLGPNGAGKTTAVRVLTTLLEPDSGVASVLGIDVTKNPQAVREQIGLAGQYAAVDGNLTGRENLRLVGRLTHQPRSSILARADELLERFSLADAADRPVKTYSGGMQRRLDLAAALVHRPRVLFLDEPTTGLDPRSRLELWTMIEELVDTGVTVLLTTQYLEEADRLADHIAVVDHGRVVAEGSSDQLKSTLGSTIIHVDLAETTRYADALRVLGPLGAAMVSEDGHGIEVKVTDKGRSLLQAVRLLDGAGIVPTALAIREPSLDDVFLTLTGHHLEDPTTEPAEPIEPAGHQEVGE